VCVAKIITSPVEHIVGYLICSGPSLHLIIECHQACKFCTNLTTKTPVVLHSDYISYDMIY